MLRPNSDRIISDCPVADHLCPGVGTQQEAARYKTWEKYDYDITTDDHHAVIIKVLLKTVKLVMIKLIDISVLLRNKVC